MSPRVVTFGAQARTAPRHLLCGAVRASRFERTERANAPRSGTRGDLWNHRVELSSWSGVLIAILYEVLLPPQI